MLIYLFIFYYPFNDINILYFRISNAMIVSLAGVDCSQDIPKANHLHAHYIVFPILFDTGLRVWNSLMK